MIKGSWNENGGIRSAEVPKSPRSHDWSGAFIHVTMSHVMTWRNRNYFCPDCT